MSGRMFPASRFARLLKMLALTLAGLLLINAPSMGQVGTPRSNTNLPGGDYRNFWADDWSYCATACKNEGQCTAWTWVRPGVQGGRGRCWLKNRTPAARQESCCISGIKGYDTRRTTYEPGINRPGGDARSFTMYADGKPADCQLACQQDGLCNAWTYVNPGIQGPAPRCWIKNGKPAAKRDSCCTSGVKPDA